MRRWLERRRLWREIVQNAERYRAAQEELRHYYEDNQRSLRDRLRRMK